MTLHFPFFFLKKRSCLFALNFYKWTDISIYNFLRIIIWRLWLSCFLLCCIVIVTNKLKKCQTMISPLCDKQGQRRNSSESCFLVGPECLEAPAHTWAALEKVSFSGHYVRNDITRATMIGWSSEMCKLTWNQWGRTRQHLKPRKRSVEKNQKSLKV